MDLGIPPAVRELTVLAQAADDLDLSCSPTRSTRMDYFGQPGILGQVATVPTYLGWLNLPVTAEHIERVTKVTLSAGTEFSAGAEFGEARMSIPRTSRGRPVRAISGRSSNGSENVSIRLLRPTLLLLNLL
jgi:hypothetical protein